MLDVYVHSGKQKGHGDGVCEDCKGCEIPIEGNLHNEATIQLSKTDSTF